MIFGAFVLAIIAAAHLPSPACWFVGVALIALFPAVYRWARASR